MIARISGDARIAQFCNQRSLRRNGNCLVQFASEIEKFSISTIATILESKGSRLSMNFSDRGLSFKINFFVIFCYHCEDWILVPNFQDCSIVVIKGKYMMQGSLTVAGHIFVRSLRHQRSLRSYGNKA